MTEQRPTDRPTPDEVDLYQLRARTMENLQLLLEQAQSEIDAMRGSTSWRVTAPLRAIGRLIRRLLGRGR